MPSGRCRNDPLARAGARQARVSAFRSREAAARLGHERPHSGLIDRVQLGQWALFHRRHTVARRLVNKQRGAASLSTGAPCRPLGRPSYSGAVATCKIGPRPLLAARRSARLGGHADHARVPSSPSALMRELQPGQRVTIRETDGSRVACEFVRRLADRRIGPYRGEQTEPIPRAIVRYDDGTCEIWPLESIEAASARSTSTP